jgi:hypothetical protein
LPRKTGLHGKNWIAAERKTWALSAFPLEAGNGGLIAFLICFELGHNNAQYGR